MAPDSETTSEKVEKDLSDLTLPEICSLNQDLNFCIKGSSHTDKGLNISSIHQNLNGKVIDDDGIPVPEVQLYPPGQVCLEWTKVHKVGAGLANLGNTCFLNTVIQCLTYCPPLANYLLQGDHSMNCKSFEFCMMCELQKHMRQVFQRSGDVIKPLCIYQNLKYIADHFQFGQQEDAHEFLRFVIDNLWRSSIYSHPNDDVLDLASRETTIINHIFGGYNRSQVVCLQCNLKSDKYEHFMDFILDIQNVHSLEKAVEQFVKPELLENENAYKCPKCNALVPAEKTFTIHRPPNVATFQLKRFHYYKSYGKITKHVSYPENFDLRPYMSQRKGGSLLYKLNAVLVHMGQNCNSGHYYCYIRNSNGFWYLMDDAKVQKVSLHDVLNQQAYVLFYIRSSHNGIHFKTNGVSSIVDFQNQRIRSPNHALPQSSSPKKSQSFRKTSERSDKTFENGSCSAVCSPPLSSQKLLNNGLTPQSFSEFNSGFSNHESDNDSLNSKCSRAFKFTNRKSPYTYDKYSTQKRIVGRIQHRNFDMQYENDSSDGRSLLPLSSDSYGHLSSSFEKNSQDNGHWKNSSLVCAYNVHNSVNCSSYGNGIEEHKNVNSAAKYQSSIKSSLHHNTFFQGENFCASRNQYSDGMNDFYTSSNFIDSHQRCYYRSLDKSVNTQFDYKSLHGKFYRHEEYNFCKNNYVNSGTQDYQLEYNYNTHMKGYVPQYAGFKDYQNNEQFSFGHHRSELIPRNIHHKTSSNNGEWRKFNETIQSNSKHFSNKSERSSGFRNNSFKKGYGSESFWRKEYSAFPNILKDYGSRIYQRKIKCNRRYFSCRMAHFASPSFPKFKFYHRPSPYHKCFYMNIC